MTMKVTILGAGNMGRAIATRMLAGGNRVTLLDRELDQAQALAQELDAQAQGSATVQAAALGSPLADPVVISALFYQVAREVISSYKDQLAGKILVDISNPINETNDDLVTPPGSSAAEELAKIAPGARVVKAFNTTFAGLLAQGHVGGEPLDVFAAGDDAEAKATVTRLVEAGGLRVFDVGPLRRARQLEGLGLLNITLQSSLAKPWMSGVKIVD
jgi:8-hydroxy-5-deazaflavin:NADPH oxidoreductase